ncbi:MAG: transcriptional regulator GcvA, partial [Pseudomonadota bacterium]
MKLPNLNALRAFEAAGRNLSFTKAAEELNVTQAAVSHQIKTLEEQLGFRLFRRIHRGLRLTEAGQAYLPDVRQAFERLETATERLAVTDARGVLTVSVLPSFAAKWLVPRLMHFQAQYPEIDVRVSANDRSVDFDQEDIDLGIRFGRGDYTGLHAVPLMQEWVFPVCSPALAERGQGLRSPEDLRHFTLLHDDMHLNWSEWLKAAGVANIDATRGPFFNDSSMLISAAVEGLGVALGRKALALGDIAAGRLVRPFELSLPTAFGYYIVYPERRAHRTKIIIFRDWLLEEAGATGDHGGT